MSKRSHRKKSLAWRARSYARRAKLPHCATCGKIPWWKFRWHKTDEWAYYCREHKPELPNRQCMVCQKKRTPWHIKAGSFDFYLCHKHKNRKIRRADIPAKKQETGGAFGGPSDSPKWKVKFSQQSIDELKQLWGDEIEKEVLAALHDEMQDAIDKQIIDGLTNVKPMTDPIGGISHWKPKYE